MSTLKDFLSLSQAKRVKIQSEGKDRYLLFDFSQFVYQSKFIVSKNVKDITNLDEYIDFYKHLTLNTIMSVVKQLYPIKRVVIAVDKSSWRKTKFGGIYKAVRKQKRADDDFDWKSFFARMEEFKLELKEHFPFVVVDTYGAEGDDVIAVLAKHLVNEQPCNEVVIVSSDKDMVQLLENPAIKIWDPKKHTYKECLVPKNVLLSHILLGDKSDGIPPVHKAVDFYVNKSSKKISEKRLGKKTVAKHITDNTVFTDLIGDSEDLKKRFDENRELIDLNYIPKEISQKIVEAYDFENKHLDSKSISSLMDYFMTNRFRNLMNSIGDFEKIYEVI